MAPGTPARDRIGWVLIDLIRPSDYMRWEYFSRQRLLGTSVLASQGESPTRILDVGCGQGALSLTLLESAGLDVVAMDLLPERASSVRVRRDGRSPAADRARIVLANEGSLPFHDEAFEAVVATEVLEHVDDPRRMFLETRRVLPAGGRFFMTTSNRGTPDVSGLSVPTGSRGEQARRVLGPRMPPSGTLARPFRRGTGAHPVRHRREGITIAELECLGDESGMRMQRAYAYRIPIPDRVMGLMTHGAFRHASRASALGVSRSASSCTRNSRDLEGGP